MYSHLSRLVEHVIKMHAQREYNSSWENTIRNAVKEISKLKDDNTDFPLELERVWEQGLSYAACQIWGGTTVLHVETIVNKELVLIHCLSLLNL